MSGGGGGETKQTTEPWSGVQPFLTDLYARVGGGARRPMPAVQGGPGIVGAGPGGGGAGAGAGAGANVAQIRQQMQRLEPGSPEWDRLQGELHRATFEPDSAGGVRPRGSGGGGGQDAQTMPGLIDQPMPIFDPVGFTGSEREAQRRMMQIGRAPVPELFGQASDALGQTIGGEYLGANPYLDDMFAAASRPIRESFLEEQLPALTSQFAGAGRQGSGAHESVGRGATEDLNRTLADMSAGLYGGAYESERGRMMQALGMAPEIGAAPSQFEAWQAGLMGDVGQARREMLEARNAAKEARAREPWERMQMAAQLYGAGSPFTTQSQPFYRNRMAGGLGGAASGAAIGSMISPGLGTGIGAGLGGLMGLF